MDFIDGQRDGSKTLYFISWSFILQALNTNFAIITPTLHFYSGTRATATPKEDAPTVPPPATENAPSTANPAPAVAQKRRRAAEADTTGVLRRTTPRRPRER